MPSIVSRLALVMKMLKVLCLAALSSVSSQTSHA
jgi:hypothetical protein